VTQFSDTDVIPGGTAVDIECRFNYSVFFEPSAADLQPFFEDIDDLSDPVSISMQGVMGLFGGCSVSAAVSGDVTAGQLRADVLSAFTAYNAEHTMPVWNTTVSVYQQDSAGGGLLPALGLGGGDNSNGPSLGTTVSLASLAILAVVVVILIREAKTL